MNVPAFNDFLKLKSENEMLLSEIKALKKENAILKSASGVSFGVIKQQIINLIEQGFKSCHIAAKLGCSREYVSRVKSEYKKALNNQG